MPLELFPGTYIRFYNADYSLLYIPTKNSSEGYLVKWNEMGGDIKKLIENEINYALPVFKKEIDGKKYFCFYTPKNLLNNYVKYLKKRNLSIDLWRNDGKLFSENFYISTDPEVVDNVLGTNFINEDNLKEFVNNIDKLEAVNNKLAELLVASRMGLKDIDEQALKKAIEGLSSVIKGLEQLKLVVSKAS